MRRVHRSLVPLAALPLLLTALSGSLYGALSAQGIEAFWLSPGGLEYLRNNVGDRPYEQGLVPREGGLGAGAQVCRFGGVGEPRRSHVC
jgi:hypothetical protein